MISVAHCISGTRIVARCSPVCGGTYICIDYCMSMPLIGIANKFPYVLSIVRNQ